MSKTNETAIAGENWSRYLYCRDRGHREYIAKAQRCENFYLGAGRQWDQSDVEALNGRPAMEINAIFAVINTAIGLQLRNRMDISFKPRNGMANQGTADVLSKVVMQICDNCSLPWLETQVYSDGVIQRRGYFDVRISFDDTAIGEVAVMVPDPLDVIPDPDANDYDPKSWNDVTLVRWMTLDDIEGLYGKDKAQEVLRASESNSDDATDHERNTFGGPDSNQSADLYRSTDDKNTTRYLIVDRQHRKLINTDVFLFPSGDVRPVPSGLDKESKVLKAQELGAYLTKRLVKKVRWTVSTYHVLLHDEWSPYEELTIVPYFPYFRRGRSRGMVDNAISPQMIFNKATSQFLHIINTSANSGWKVEEDSLANMTTDELEDRGAETGLVVEFKKGRKEPEKILPNQVPTGTDRLADKCEMYIKSVTGISDAMQGLNGPEVSGVAIQSKQYMGQAQMGGPLDNLARTRNILARRILELVQRWYDSERVMVITQDTESLEAEHVQMRVNYQDEISGDILNDLTVGEYEVVIDEVPNQSTFDSGQFEQALAMRKEGVAIPDSILIRHSNLTRKKEILLEIENAKNAPPDPIVVAQTAEIKEKTRLLKAQTEKTLIQAVGESVDAQYGAMQSAQVIASNPLVAAIAERLLGSSGYQDQDQPPVVPLLDGGRQQDFGSNTNPMTPIPLPAPDSPFEGQQAGMETIRNDL